MLKSAVLVLACGTLFGGTIVTDTSCPMGVSMAVYADEAFACQFGGLTFYGFSFAGSTIQGVQVALDADAVTVVPYSAPTDIGFIFTGPFSALPGSVLEYTISLVGDPKPPLIRGYSISLNLGTRRTDGPRGAADLSSTQCQTTMDSVCESESTVNSYISGMDEQLRDVVFFTPVPIVGADLRLALDGTVGEVVVQSIAASFHIESSLAPVPEPGVAWLASSGLAIVIFAKWLLPAIQRLRQRRA